MTGTRSLSAFVSRFRVIAVGAALLLTASCAHLGGVRAPSRQGYSILQGLTSETSAEFSVLVEGETLPRFTVVTPTGETLAPAETAVITRPHSRWRVHKLRFAGLLAHADPHQLVIDGPAGLDRRHFRPFSNQGEQLRFIAGSCADARSSSEQAATWKALREQRPEWVFLIGDNVYATRDGDATPKQLWDRYVEGRLGYDMYYWPELVPVYAVWDDNDYGQNNGGAGYPHREESQAVFRAFWAQSFANDLHAPGPGVAGRLQLRGMHFTFLDNRSFRAPNGPGEHFGPEQESWLFADLQKAQLPTWIVSGDQFFGGHHTFESYEGNHPEAFARFLGRLQSHATPVVFLSGDRHFTEIMQFPRALVGQLSFEFTTGPLHAKVYPGRAAAEANPWRVVSQDGINNFLLVQTALEDTSWRVQAEARSVEGPLFSRDLSMTTEALKDFTIEKRQRRRKFRRARWRKR
jgi:alkaline phosphatase D